MPSPKPSRRHLPPVSLLTIHAHVLLTLAVDPKVFNRVLAAPIGVNVSTVIRAIKELKNAGFITVARVGRSNQYVVHQDRPLNDPAAPSLSVRDLVKFGTVG
jgi:Winged helix-turn-helix DNA-binding